MYCRSTGHRRDQWHNSWDLLNYLENRLTVRQTNFIDSLWEVPPAKLKSKLVARIAKSEATGPSLKLNHVACEPVCWLGFQTLRMWACRPLSPYTRKTNHILSERNRRPMGICQCWRKEVGGRCRCRVALLQHVWFMRAISSDAFASYDFSQHCNNKLTL